MTTGVRVGLPVVGARRATWLGVAGEDLLVRHDTPVIEIAPRATAALLIQLEGTSLVSHFDLPLDQLRTYRPEREEPADFDAFWRATLDEARAAARPPRFEPAYPELRAIETYDVTFTGFAGQEIKAWLLVPRHRSGPVPVVVEYVGYGGGRGLPSFWLGWPSAGYATFVMDTRGQGGAWVTGATPDMDPDGFEPQVAGWLTRGILDPGPLLPPAVHRCRDGALPAARAHPAIDPERVVVAGGSQGGGIALAAAALDG